jgi:hypothetical protein
MEYYHQMLAAVIAHPDKKTVLPLAPEPIIKQQDASKNDCEINAAKRLRCPELVEGLPKIRALFPTRKILIVADGIYSNGPFIRLLKELGFDYILVAKEADHVTLVREYVEKRAAGKAEEFEEVKDGVVRGFCWVNDVSLNATHQGIRVNLLDFWEVIGEEEKTSNWIWVTSLKLTQQAVYPVMRAGRCRWKVENETFASTGSAQATH